MSSVIKNSLDTNELEQKATREGYGQGLLEAGEKDERVVALCADLTESTKTDLFAKKFPNRFVEIGVAEQNLAAVAAGLAEAGKIPFIASYATFSPGRNWEQIRTTACYNNAPVKIAGCHAGLSVGPDGATHQALEDIAIMRALPNMTVIVPCDAEEAYKATLAAAQTDGPVYIRLAREKSAVFTIKDTPFAIGRAEIFYEADGRSKPDVAILATGPLVYQSLQAAQALKEHGVKVRVINFHTVKPIDKDMIVAAAKDAGAVVTVEEHQRSAGFGSAVSEVLAQNVPAPQEFVAMPDSFGESGPAEALLRKYKLDVPAIIEAVHKVIKRKK